MAQKRMLDKKISVSEQVANLCTEAQLVFTWSIPHADDLGLLPFSHRTLKALIVPMKDMSLEDFGFHVESIVSQGLWVIFTHGKDQYYRLPNFFGTQTLKKDRNPSTLLTFIKTWNDAEDIGFQMEDIGNLREEKGREDKEEKRETGDKSPSSIWEEKVRSKDAEYRELVASLAATDYLTPIKINRIVLEEFLPHWLEKSEGAKKARWQKETSFDYQRRIRTWIANFHKYARDYKCRSDMWHVKGESCHHEKEEIPVRREISPEAKALGASKRVVHG